MPGFVFKFAPVLRVRLHERNLRRQMLADALAEDRALLERRLAVERFRDELLREMKELLDRGTVDVDRSARRRYHAGQLAGELRIIDEQRRLVAEQVERCRGALVEADRRVKALEKLAEHAEAEHRSSEERRTARQLEESWLAAHLLKGSKE